jgi:hypothetical protein
MGWDGRRGKKCHERMGWDRMREEECHERMGRDGIGYDEKRSVMRGWDGVG